MDPKITDERSYPAGVPSWIDVATADPEATCTFYSGLFGWTFEDAVPPGAPGSYLIASLDGHAVAAVRPESSDDGWISYIATDDVDSLAEEIEAAGGSVRSAPEDVGPAGRGAEFADPQGAVFRGWRAGTRLGAQVVNLPGTWNFSYLRTPDPGAAVAFYREVLGWEVDPELGAGMIRLPGYGAHLAATIDPGILERQEFAPPGFEDVVAGLIESPDARWSIAFTVSDRDAAVARARELGATIVSSEETTWTKEAEIADPRGSLFTVSEMVMPD